MLVRILLLNLYCRYAALAFLISFWLLKHNLQQFSDDYILAHVLLSQCMQTSVCVYLGLYADTFGCPGVQGMWSTSGAENCSCCSVSYMCVTCSLRWGNLGKWTLLKYWLHWLNKQISIGHLLAVLSWQFILHLCFFVAW